VCRGQPWWFGIGEVLFALVAGSKGNFEIRLEPTMAERIGRGTLTGRWEPRPGGRPNIRGGITIERDIPAKTRLWLTGWTKTIADGALVSVLVEIADEGGRPEPVIGKR
jgi:hypothetical protein